MLLNIPRSPHIIPATVSISTSIWPLDIWLSTYPCPTTHRQSLYNKRLLSCSSAISDISCVVLGEAALPHKGWSCSLGTNDFRKVTNMPKLIPITKTLKHFRFSTCLLTLRCFHSVFELICCHGSVSGRAKAAMEASRPGGTALLLAESAVDCQP